MNRKQETEAWKRNTYVMGAGLGAILGLAGAYLFARAADETDDDVPPALVDWYPHQPAADAARPDAPDRGIGQGQKALTGHHRKHHGDERGAASSASIGVKQGEIICVVATH